MDIISQLITRARASKQRIVLPEGSEGRTLRAADRAIAEGLADIILLGDPAQIDHPLLDEQSNGLSYAADRMRGSPLCVQLTMLPDECERSELALDAAMRM